MGYTHYWTFQRPATSGLMEDAEERYQAAIRECARIVRAYYAAYGGLSGYTAHTSGRKYGGIGVNGKGDLAHEDFDLAETFAGNFKAGFGGFCKTARKPYDTVVTACLAVLATRIPDLIRVSSDGHPEDWSEGVGLARLVLRRKGIINPIAERAA